MRPEISSHLKPQSILNVPPQVLLDDSPHCLLHLRTGTEKSAARDFNGCTGFLQCHELPEISIRLKPSVLLRLPKASIFLPAKRAGRLVVFVPEVFLHPWGHYDFATFIVNGCVGQVGVECDAVLGRPALDAAAQLTRIDEDMTVWSHRATSALPCLAEECLTLKVLVELVGHLHLDVLKDSS